ncbi:MAG: CPBP family intramembrane metalloprotease [Lachnospiraceae bacterium]|nr:CPBP family intramembrane metalloprotease [Lachnospiraceae bacterium]MDE6981211.1 CPBP family intramembrane metalloprotease [Lachnospiraceae bacterium]
MKKVGYFFFSFLPPLASITLQFVVMIPFVGIATIAFLNNPSSFTNYATLDDITSLVSFSSGISAAYAAAGIVIFGLWYQLQFKGNVTKNVKQWMNPKMFLGVLCTVPVLQVATGFLITFVSSLFPQWLKFYENLMDSAGLSGNLSLFLVLYAVILGPVAEELTFRGVTLASAKRALPFWAANLLQAFLFGVFHMNMIQGIYAFGLGIVLGVVCEKSGCIWYSIALHIGFNFWGTFASEFLAHISPIAVCILYIIFIFLGILGAWLISHNLPAKENFSSTSKESQFPSDIYYK